MSGIRVPGSAAPSHWLSALTSWLLTGPSATWQSSEDFQSEPGRMNVQPCESVRILVVDDNPVNLIVISALMEPRGLVPVLAADGAEAVALACEIRFDLILMDLQMPILDGWAATAAIRNFERTCARLAVPVVAYSSISPSAGVLASCGFNGSLDKPCDDHALEDCLIQWCPAYHSVPTSLGTGHHDNRWQPANRYLGERGASVLRPGA